MVQSLLIMPIQRIPRYKLLLVELIRQTPSDHPDLEQLNKADQIVAVFVTVYSCSLYMP